MKIRPVSRLLSVALLCTALAACSFNERIADHAVKYNKTVEETRNSLLLLNILRAKDRRPMQFTALTKVLGRLTLQSSGKLGLDIPFGGDAASTFPLSPSFTLTQTSSPSFDVVSLDSQEFMKGILSPIKQSTFEFYWHQRWPREVLLHLFIHDVDITYKPWAASTDYLKGSTILENGLLWTTSKKGTSAGEPKWDSKPDAPPVEDNDIVWKASFKTNPWLASTEYKAGANILENGLVWESLSRGTSKALGDKPIWGSNPGDRIIDNDITWKALYKANPWAASTEYEAGANILEEGLIWAALGRGTSAGEPKWETDRSKPVPDNDITWKAMTRDEQEAAQESLVNAPHPEKLKEFENFQNWINTIIDVKELDFGTSKTGRPIGAELKLVDQAVLEHLVEAEKAELRLVKISETKTEPTRYRL